MPLEIVVLVRDLLRFIDERGGLYGYRQNWCVVFS